MTLRTRREIKGEIKRLERVKKIAEVHDWKTLTEGKIRALKWVMHEYPFEK